MLISSIKILIALLPFLFKSEATQLTYLKYKKDFPRYSKNFHLLAAKIQDLTLFSLQRSCIQAKIENNYC